MEELLNKLIEKGWKPRGEEEIKSCQIGKSFYDRKFIESSVGFYIDDRGTPQRLFTKSLREVCSKSSGLWQFVCENEMVNGVDRWTLNARQKSIYDKYITSEKEYTPKMNYEYRLIESSLKDESELEKFLLDNIKVE